MKFLRVDPDPDQPVRTCCEICGLDRVARANELAQALDEDAAGEAFQRLFPYECRECREVFYNILAVAYPEDFEEFFSKMRAEGRAGRLGADVELSPDGSVKQLKRN